MNVLEKMKLTSELQRTVGLRNLERNPLQKLSLAKKVQDLRKQLGLIESDNVAQPSEYADVVVSNQSGKFLLVQRSLNDKFKPGKWWIPGGHIEQNEEPKEAANRELKEETGISGSDLAFLEKKSLPNGGISHRFALKAENDNVTLQQKELDDYAWVTLAEIEKYPLVGDVGDLMQLFKLAVPETDLDVNVSSKENENSSQSEIDRYKYQTLENNNWRLSGSERQIAAANVLRDDYMRSLSQYQKAFMANYPGTDKASFWIDNAGMKFEFFTEASYAAEQDKVEYAKFYADKSVEQGLYADAIYRYGRFYLDVPFEEKDLAKLFGAKWDSQLKKWFVYDEVRDELKKYLPIQEQNQKSETAEEEIQPLQIPENATPQEREKLALNWLKDNVQGKTITAVDGKKIIFNRKLSTEHLSHNARKDQSSIVAKCIPFIADIFQTGRFIERQPLRKERTDGKVAFHLYEKWVEVEKVKVLLEAKACEYGDGRLEARGEAVAYNLKWVNEMATRTPSNLSPVTDNALGESLSPFMGDATLFFDNMQAEYDYILSIKAITDLDGNPIDFDDEEIVPTHMPDNQPPKAAMFNYNKEGESTPAKRQAANKKAIELVKMLLDGSLKKEDLTIEQKITLSEYSGNGGNMTDANGNKGSQYEYYTPKEIAGGMWELLKASGFTGGKVLDPCAGTGIFAATSPDGILMDNVELSEVSGTINKAIFENESHKTTISPFEAVAAATPDEQYDAVITNVPFGSNADRGGNQYKDSLYQDESLDHYFILRSLKKLRPNGLAVFMCATKVLTGTKYRKQRLMMSEMAEFIGAYRLPDHVFGSAGAGVVTDVLVFKKHSNETKTRIDDVLKEDKQGIKLLEKANVYWQPFVSGKYYQLHPTNVLGTVAQVKNRYGLVESIQSDATMAEIAKLMQKLGGSRIDWAMLQSQEGGFITYQDGDTQYFDGVMKTYQNGKWETVELAENNEGIAEQLRRRLSAYGSPLQIIEEKQPLAELLDIVRTVQERQISLQILPDWLRVLMKQAQAE